MLRTLISTLILIPTFTFAAIREDLSQVYSLAKKQAIDSVGPIIISKGGVLVLLYKGQREEVTYIPAEYHQLKMIAHIPLILHLILSTDADPQKLRALKNEIEASTDPILVETTTFLEKLLSDILAESEKMQFFQNISPLLLQNAADAAFLQLDALHQQVQKWKGSIPREDWNKLAAIVIGPQMPRIGEVSMQYFARLTGKQLEKASHSYEWLSRWQGEASKSSKKMRRLVYAESIQTEEEAVNLLATHIVDERIGSVFFNDDRRMTCDLLAEAASKRLHEKCPH